MTQEEKASRYNEAIYNNYKSFTVLIERLESVKSAVKEHNYGIAMDILYKPYPDFQITTHPELKESEDERIRKEIISHLKYLGKYCEESMPNVNEWIAWLEKQGEQKPINKIQLGKKYKCIASPRYSTFMLGKIYKPEDKFLCSLMNFCSDCFVPIEDGKQKSADKKEEVDNLHNYLYGEQKHADKVEQKFKVGDRIIEKDFDECGCGTIIDIKDGKYIFDDGGFIYIEEQGLWQLVEQKPADKVEPKFKVGDWIVCYNHDVDKIVKFDDDKVSFESGEWLYINQLNRDCRLWTIQDAKDGDILTHSDKSRFKHDWIGIFKEYNNSNDSVSTYCYMPHDNTKFYINEDSIDPKNLKPATKEQRDLLFQKMKEAGYEWDAEQNQLKKIEQKPADNVEPKFRVGDTIIAKLETCMEHEPFHITNISDGFYWSGENSILVDNQNEFELYKVEPKFREGDWVVCEVTGSVYQINYCIENPSNHKYGYDLINGGYIGNDDVNHYHLWTIADAKDGDVLYECNEKEPFIFKELKTKHIGDIASYCDIFNGIFNPNKDSWTTLDIVPATKEQRDRLEKAMADAGYTFDFEKKELKKIEQRMVSAEAKEALLEEKPTELLVLTDRQTAIDTLMQTVKVLKERGLYSGLQESLTALAVDLGKSNVVKPAEWSEEDESYLKVAIENCYECGNNYIAQWLKSLRPEPKQEWSEEDENMMNKCVCSMRAVSIGFPEDEDFVNKLDNWLKSLKDRVQPQPKQEWSQNDIDMIDWLIRCCEKEHEELCNDKYGHQDIVSDLKRDCRTKWNWLESLKNKVVPQNTWKPSDEQMDALKYTTNFDYGGHKVTLISLYNDLKKLRQK